MKNLLWIDVETTDLDPGPEACLLEIAAVITDHNLNELGSFEATLKYDPDELPWGEEAREMHEQNGLFEDVRNGRYERVEDLEKDLIMWYLKAYPGSNDLQLPLAGSNPEFDRLWVLAWFPSFSRFIHYRNFDVNALYTFFDVDKDKTGRERTHRAMDDVRSDIRFTSQLETIRKAFIKHDVTALVREANDLGYSTTPSDDHQEDEYNPPQVEKHVFTNPGTEIEGFPYDESDAHK